MNDAAIPDLSATWNEVWTLLQGHLERRAGPREYVTLASVDLNGAPQQRTVALRAAEQSTASLMIYTDLASHKVAEIRAEPRVSVLSWHPEVQVQLRLNGHAKIESGADLRRTRAVWRKGRCQDVAEFFVCLESLNHRFRTLTVYHGVQLLHVEFELPLVLEV